MGWGACYNKADKEASPAQKAGAERSMSSVQAAGAAVGRAASTVAQVGGEIVNTAVGTAVIAAMSLFSAVKRLFIDPPAPVMACFARGVDITKNEYRKGLVNSTFEGTGDPRLAQAMRALSEDISDQEAAPHLQTIAELRKRPITEVRDEYDLFKQIRNDRDDRIVASGGRLQPIAKLGDQQANFMGSTWQLRYGKIAGDHLGVDPVFGAMLNPTGGLVGEEDKGISIAGIHLDGAPEKWPEAVAYHGAYHDAMGHLYNYHDYGPGYNYIGSPIGLSTDKPLAGQATGIAQWAFNLF
jgi:hypothetical protein